MTQTQAQAPPATAAPPAPADRAEDVPRLLDRLQVLVVVACVLFGVLAALLQILSWQANGRAADNTEQVVRVQQIQSLLLRADALATNSYLVGGLEDPDARAEYDAAIDGVLRLVADAAEAQPADRKVLADLNAAVTTYTTAVTQARDYNRQQFPIGIAYLNDAGSSLRNTALPITKALADTNSDRAVDEMGGQHPFWLLLVGILVLGLLYVANRHVARRFHRRYNVGLVVAGVVVALVTVVVAGHAQVKARDNGDLRDGSYATAVDEATTRTAANNAKAIESQGLINRGSGSSVYEPKWDEQAAIVVDHASPNTLPLWEAYAAAHEAVRKADDAGEWDAAVDLATTTSTGSATELLDQVDASAEKVSAAAGAEAAEGFRSGSALSVLLIVLTGLAALVAAFAASRGIGVRRREYS
jgi:NADH:ubiquinone oxidoreductase subunit 6 (subunit J)